MSKNRFETKALHTVVKKKTDSKFDISTSYTEMRFPVFSETEIQKETYESYSEANSLFPNQNLLQRFCEIENFQDGIFCSSGNIAIYQTILALTNRGDHILISKTCSPLILKIVTNLKEKMGIKFSFLDLSKPQKWKSQINQKTRLLFIESLSIPSLQIPDLNLLSKFAKKHSLLFALENSYCTPFLHMTSEYGADCVVYSDSVYLDGQSRLSAGVIIGKRKLIDKIRKFSIEQESVILPFHSCLLERGLETLALRMEKHSTNALKVAEYLEGNSVFQKVVYPFLPSYPDYKIALKQMKFGGSIISFSMEGGVVRGRRFIECLKKFSNPSQASIRTTILHPVSTTHLTLPEKIRLQMGARSNLILLSVGLEHIDDILQEIEQAISDSKIVIKLQKKEAGY